MPIKVKKTTATSSNLSADIDLLSDVKASKKTKDKIKQEVGEFLVEQTLLAVGDAKSPISGESFPSLSPGYKKLKLEEGRGSKANLEFNGDMLDSLSFQPTSDGIKIGHIKTDQAPKADGHNNFSGESGLRKRRYLPKEGQNYKKDIVREVNRIIADNLADEVPIPKSKLERVQTKTELFELLSTVFVGMSKREASNVIKRSEEMTGLFKQLNLFRFLF